MSHSRTDFFEQKFDSGISISIYISRFKSRIRILYFRLQVKSNRLRPLKWLLRSVARATSSARATQSGQIRIYRRKEFSIQHLMLFCGGQQRWSAAVVSSGGHAVGEPVVDRHESDLWFSVRVYLYTESDSNEPSLVYCPPTTSPTL